MYGAVSEEETFYRLSMIYSERVGQKAMKQMLQRFGTAKEIFNADLKEFSDRSGLAAAKAGLLQADTDRARLDKELDFLRKHDIKLISITDEEYPDLLKSCADAPAFLYYRGTADLRGRHMVAIVGTRKNTEYGRRATEELVEGLRDHRIAIVSGLALGIDVIAHRKAIQCGIPTIGVMAHGIDRIYPGQHKHIARDMVACGGLLTEYRPGTEPERHNFPMRNRIVAGMSEVTIVVETGLKGGAMITARLASGYNREVAALPGRSIDRQSEGCNRLIADNEAQLINGAGDLLSMMNWDSKHIARAAQLPLFPETAPGASPVVALLQAQPSLHIDELHLRSGLDYGTLSAALLQMELNGVLECLPGKRYRLL